MKIVFFGTPDFAAASLKRLIQDGHEVLAAFTRPDMPKGRGYKMVPPPVKEVAMEHGIPVFQPTKLKNGEVARQLREMGPEIVVVVAYGRILPRAILDVPPLGCVNVHGSLLPAYRGSAPIQWTVLNGEKEAGVTTMYMEEGLDCGDMILKRSVPVGENETSEELYHRLEALGAECLSETMVLFAGGKKAPAVPQDDSKSSLAPMLEKAMGRLDFTKTAQEVHNWIRGMNSWPSAFTKYNGKLLKIHRSIIEQQEGVLGKPGEVIDPENFVVACGKGAVRLKEVQLEGAKRLDAKTFPRGKALTKGEVLGEDHPQ